MLIVLHAVMNRATASQIKVNANAATLARHVVIVTSFARRVRRRVAYVILVAKHAAIRMGNALTKSIVVYVPQIASSAAMSWESVSIPMLSVSYKLAKRLVLHAVMNRASAS